MHKLREYFSEIPDEIRLTLGILEDFIGNTSSKNIKKVKNIFMNLLRLLRVVELFY